MEGDSELRRSVEARIGSTLRGKYLLEGLLGVGGMAAVYRATNTVVHRACAVKVLHQDVSRITEARDRFLREGRVANTVRHHGAVDVLDGDVAEDGSAFLVMELLEGDSAEELRASSGNRLDVRVIAALAAELLDVLAAAHSKGVVHRDIKPANLFVTRNGELKVLDFGIAQLRDTGANITRTGMSMGTPSFMAPEQALGRTSEVGPRSDVWSVGATMFALLTGRNVHLAETAQEMMVLVATKPAPGLLELVPDVPPPIAAVVDRSLAFEREGRWPGAREMHMALASAYQAAFGTALPPLAAVLRSPPAAPDISAWAATLHDSHSAALPPPSALAAPPRGHGNTTVEPFAAEAVAGLPRSRIAPWHIAVALGGLVLVGLVGTLAWMRPRAATASNSVDSSATSSSAPTTTAAPKAPAAPATESAPPKPSGIATPNASASATAAHSPKPRATIPTKPGPTTPPPPKPRDPLAP